MSKKPIPNRKPAGGKSSGGSGRSGEAFPKPHTATPLSQR